MQNEIVTTAQALPMDQHPAFVYLAGLSSERSRRVQKQALEAIADLLTGQPDLMGCDWSALRFQHTQAIKSRLAETYSPATANRMLSALRWTLNS